MYYRFQPTVFTFSFSVSYYYRIAIIYRILLCWNCAPAAGDVPHFIYLYCMVVTYLSTGPVYYVCRKRTSSPRRSHVLDRKKAGITVCDARLTFRKEKRQICFERLFCDRAIFNTKIDTSQPAIAWLPLFLASIVIIISLNPHLPFFSLHKKSIGRLQSKTKTKIVLSSRFTAKVTEPVECCLHERHVHGFPCSY